MNLFPGEKASEYAATTHSTETRPMVKKLCMTVARTFLALTMPP
jgi:hypothetical protein